MNMWSGVKSGSLSSYDNKPPIISVDKLTGWTAKNETNVSLVTHIYVLITCFVIRWGRVPVVRVEFGEDEHLPFVAVVLGTLGMACTWFFVFVEIRIVGFLKCIYSFKLRNHSAKCLHRCY